jgi:hypothetical protein
MERGALGLLALVVLWMALAAWGWCRGGARWGAGPPGPVCRRHAWLSGVNTPSGRLIRHPA